MHKEMDTFIKLAKRIFKFIEKDFEFKIESAERNVYGSYITYKNATTAIRISFEPREGGIFILMIRLVDGQIPAYPVSITPSSELNSFYLDDLLSIRAPSQKIIQKIDNILIPNELQNVMQQYAEALQKYAADILNGDFKSFKQLDRIVKKRSLKT